MLYSVKASRPLLRSLNNFAPKIQRASLSRFKAPVFWNEPEQQYAKGSPERAKLNESIAKLKKELPATIPLPQNVRGPSFQKPGLADLATLSSSKKNPSAHREIIANWQPATEQDVRKAIGVAVKEGESWKERTLADRAAIFLRAAELVSTKYRYELIAATMLGQGKNAWQGEIDAGAEICDLLRWYVQCAFELHAQQPHHSRLGSWNRQEYRPLEGFVYSISPFNFTALGVNLAFGPALMGNTVIWKPSNSALHASWLLYKVMIEAGMPPEVVQWVPGDPEMVTRVCLDHRELAGISFTGSTEVFKGLLAKVGENTGKNVYRQYPRMVGETGGKNFHLIHKSANIDNAVNQTIRAAFEYQGQKCSAASRVYVPESVWPEFKEKIVERTANLKVGNPEKYDNFVNSVIHEGSFDKLNSVIQNAKSDSKVELLVGGKASKEEGYYIYPTLYQVYDPKHELMQRELFGPISAIYVYPDNEWKAVIKDVDSTSEYGLTGSVFAQDQAALAYAEKHLSNAAGNFYINVKCTGAVIGQQPFGGTRGSGTNDKVGSMNVVSRFTSVRTISENFGFLDEVEYPSNEV